ncbi:serine hydrolase domain-containing protein [Chryseobacterium sp.]|uniref:serine hydrolase domain-containing protein n=1 Tax=Chryseobacterium sp. TaxID=1871047 RepID=UPI0011CABF09|nr:serine hydrolase domain-containing protein [Chryseobacterium sp.]TXF74872.1 serine hydrolase [Chryseobacterium sp.]
MNRFTAFLAVLAFCSGFAQTFNTEKMNTLMNALDQNKKFMGSVAVSKEGKTIYNSAFGFADAENNIKNTPDTKFRIGSISKTFTAVLVMKALEENRLKLEDPLSKYFPQIKNADKITVEQLLNHRSGIHNVTDLSDYQVWSKSAQSHEQMVTRIVSGGNDFEPGAEMSYSNSNYILLSYILESVYKKPFAKLLEEKITKPLSLKNTYYGGKIIPSNKEAYSYIFAENYVRDGETDMSVPSGAGGVVSTAADLLKFAEGLFNGKLVSAESLHKMMKMTDGYGYGLFTVPFNESTGYGHSGGIDGFTSALYYFPDTKTGYAMISNGSAFDNNRISLAALSAASGKDFDIPSFKTVAVPAEELKKLEGTYASPSLPLKITVTVKNGLLFAQATGQSEFPLEATSPKTFKFDAAGIELEFDAPKKQMILNQSGASYTFTRE